MEWVTKGWTLFGVAVAVFCAVIGVVYGIGVQAERRPVKLPAKLFQDEIRFKPGHAVGVHPAGIDQAPR
jgi:hypothetical protein